MTRTVETGDNFKVKVEEPEVNNGVRNAVLQFLLCNAVKLINWSRIGRI